AVELVLDGAGVADQVVAEDEAELASILAQLVDGGRALTQGSSQQRAGVLTKESGGERGASGLVFDACQPLDDGIQRLLSASEPFDATEQLVKRRLGRARFLPRQTEPAIEAAQRGVHLAIGELRQRCERIAQLLHQACV